MKKELKLLKKELKNKAKSHKYERDENNRLIVNMTVKDDSEFLSVYSESSAPKISTDVAEFIEHSTQALPPNDNLTLRIYSNCIDDIEKEEYRSAIKEYYTEQYVANEREYKRNRIIIAILASAGILFLALALALHMHDIWSEVVDIVAWVLLWEAVDIAIFQNRSLKIKKLRCLSYIGMNIEYFNI